MVNVFSRMASIDVPAQTAGLEPTAPSHLKCPAAITKITTKVGYNSAFNLCVNNLPGKLKQICKNWLSPDNGTNFEDGMTDCSDSECCTRPECTEHIMCLASNDPVEVLLRKQPPSVTASFYQRVKFLIEENSVQSYAHMDEYSER